ncbi:hypothetical protein Gohar_010229 [Gossypium harknessii]|uniref:Uncharacterized protein n=1 Tax=Gossypium harknessii TaxID=34285 RepID=A0A7J9GQ85_9ROSI|nr:hypothetical protein [Gossypium harknessii]
MEMMENSLSMRSFPRIFPNDMSSFWIRFLVQVFNVVGCEIWMHLLLCNPSYVLIPNLIFFFLRRLKESIVFANGSHH